MDIKAKLPSPHVIWRKSSVRQLPPLFGIPITIGIIITILDVLVLLLLQNRGLEYLETHLSEADGFIIFCSFACKLAISKPSIHYDAFGINSQTKLLPIRTCFYIAIGIIGTTVMP